MRKSPAVARKKIEIGDIVLVKWQDACTRGGWKSLADYKSTQPLDVVSVGYLITKTNAHITLVQTVSEDSVADSITIPKPWITEMKKIK